MIELSTLFFLVRSLAVFASDAIESAIAEHEEIHVQFTLIRKELELMQAYLEDAEEERVRRKGMDAWLGQVKAAAYQLEDLIDQFLALVQGRSGGGVLAVGNKVLRYPKDIAAARDILANATRVKYMIHVIWETRNQLGFTGSSGIGRNRRHNEFPANLPRFDEGENAQGIEQNVELLMQLLVPPIEGRQQKQRLVVASVCGMGGLGKTTLAKAVYRHPAVERWFEALIWITVTESYDMAGLLKCIVDELQRALKDQFPEGGESSNSTSAMTSKIFELLDQKRYLIILDDVWDDSDCKKLIDFLPSNNNGSRILVTTRNEYVASSVSTSGHVLNIDPLSASDARLLFHKVAFGDATCPRELDHWAQMIINKCDGLPLAIVAIGRMMSREPSTDAAWKDMFQRLEWELSNNRMLEAMAKGLMLSYKRLPYYLQRCFLYLCMFKEGHQIKVKWLIRMWMAEGFIVVQDGNNDMTMEEIGVCYVEQLAAMSMLQVVKKDGAGRPKTCRVHDIMRDLARTASKGENLSVGTLNQLMDHGGNCRRLSIMKSLGTVPPELPLSHIRTLLVFTNDTSFASSLMTICESLKFLRVLDLKGAPIHDLPNNVFKLFNLRYLSLRETNVSKIPRTVEKLYNLQTLDLWKTKVTGLPRRMLKLQRLRHLYMRDILAEELVYRNTGQILRGPGAPSGISDLRDLQTLRTIRASKKALVELESMTQLRDLGVTKLREGDGYTMCNSIRKMTKLSRLYISAPHEESLQLDGLTSPPADLRKLILNGVLKSVPVWFSSLNSLTHLYLFSSWLTERESPIPSLGALPNLVLLALVENAYQGEILQFKAGAFLRLEILLLSRLEGLYDLRVEEGGLPSLREMYLGHLKTLRVVAGIKYITTMQALQLWKVPAVLDPSALKHFPQHQAISLAAGPLSLPCILSCVSF